MADQATAARIVAAVEARRDQIVQLLRDIVQLESVTGNEGPAQEYVAGALRDLGMTVDMFEPDLAELAKHPGFRPQPGLHFAGRPNVVGVLDGDPAARSLVLNAHIDTIPLGPADEWTEAGPLSGESRDGEVYGRGSSDMKCGLATFIAALQVLLETGLRPRGKVILQSVVDEEVSGLGTLACIQRGYTADAGICGETSDMQIMPAAIGRLWFKIEVRGKSAGIATRWLAVDAIQKAVKIINAVADLEQMRLATLTHPLYPDNRMALPCSVNMINAGSYPSATPEVAVLQGSLGTMPYEQMDEVKAQLIRQVELVSQADPWLREHPPKVIFDGYTADGAEIPLGHPIVDAVSAAYRAALKQQPTYGGRTGAADTRFLIRYGNTPTVIFGPGVTAKMHMINESVPVQNVVDAVKVAALAIYDWCSADRPASERSLAHAEYSQLPANLPVPEEDGACAHLPGMAFPGVALPATDGRIVDVAEASRLMRTVLYIYPRTGRPGEPLPTDWDMIPGARGCTPEACAFRDHHAELQALQAQVFGLSTQSTDYQQELAERLHLPFPVLSDADLALTTALRLPTFTVDGMTLVRRLTLIVDQGVITHVFYPVFPPDGHAADVVSWLGSHPDTQRSERRD